MLLAYFIFSTSFFNFMCIIQYRNYQYRNGYNQL
jgi:hypothetical protein